MQNKAQSASDLDINIKDPQELPTDTVSSISWTPCGNTPTFATVDWASYIRIYNLDSEASILTQQACFDALSPCLSVRWQEDETRVLIGCTDGSVKLFDVASGNCSMVGKHERPVKSVHWLSQANALLTLSFDKTLRFWDPRQAIPAAVYRLDYKPLCSDVMHPYLTIGLSEGKCLVVDLLNTQAALERNIKYWDSVLGDKTQITSIRIYNTDKGKIGFGLSGNDRRCNISHFADSKEGLGKLDTVITFKAHRSEERANYYHNYPVNCSTFHSHRGYQLFCTGGGEGKMIFWDLHKKNKIAEFDFKENPVTQTEIDPTGKYLAYALGYDWARGIGGYMSQPSKVCIHALKDTEFEPSGYPLKSP